ncbi:hypothetical protein RhiirB3_438868 [Rhizophagus irregularis]|nr:hypothetical protein RhiirB3_438868 [Rhizophagus irregularis]
MGLKEILYLYYYFFKFEKKVKKITTDGKTKDKTARLIVYKDMLQYLPNVILDYMNNITLKSVTNGNNQSHETLKTVPSGNNQTNVLEVQVNTLILAEKKLLKEKYEKFINFVINQFKRTNLYLNLYANIDRLNRFLLYLLNLLYMQKEALVSRRLLVN